MLKLKSIVQGVAMVTGVSVVEIAGRSRSASTVRARHLAMWIARRQMRWSLGQIGDAVGSRDHTTVLHGCRMVARAVAVDPAVVDLAADAEAMARDIQSGVKRYLDTTREAPQEDDLGGRGWGVAIHVAENPEKPASDDPGPGNDALERLSRMPIKHHAVGSRLWCEIQNARFFLAVGYPYQPTLAANATERRGVAA